MKIIVVDLMLSENQCKFIKQKLKKEKKSLNDYLKLMLLTKGERYLGQIYEDDVLVEGIEQRGFI